MSNFEKNYGISILNPAPIGRTATIAVTGLGRSGTTMLSRTLMALEMEMGSHLTPQSAEDKKIQLLLKSQDLQGFGDLCRARDAEHPIWAFKCPALRTVLDASMPQMRNPRVVLVFRDILAVSQRNAISVDANLLESMEQAARGYVKLIQQFRNIPAPVLLVSYEKALQYPQALVQALAEFCGKTISEEQAADIASKTIQNADPRYTGVAG